MQVKEVLDKITEKNAPVVGCIARKGDQMHHNLGDFGLDCTQIADTVEDLLTVSQLIGEDEGLDTVLAEYDGHCLIGQRIDDSMLITVSEPLQRAGFKKLQVGLSLQTRMLSKALDAAPEPQPEAASATPAPEETPAPEAEKVVVAQEAPRKSAWSSLMQVMGTKMASAGTAAEPTPEEIAGKKRKVYRGQVYYE